MPRGDRAARLRHRGEGLYIYNRRPGNTASSVQWAFYEPEPSKLLRKYSFWKWLARLKEKIRRKKKEAVEQSSNSDREGNGLTFDNLPYDVKVSIFEMVNSLPGWVHFKFIKGQLVNLGGTNQDIYVNQEWNQSPYLLRGLSITNPIEEAQVGVKALAGGILRLLVKDEHDLRSLQERHWGDSAFFIEIKNKMRTTPVRRQIDWFFFDGTVDMKPNNYPWPMPLHLYKIRKCVFRLDDVYEGLRRDPSSTPPPDFIWPRHSQIEELIVLVGAFRKDIAPSKMKEIRSFQVDKVLKKIKKPYIDYGEGLTNSENFMVGDVSKKLARLIVKKRKQRHDWLRSGDGFKWLSYEVHDDYNFISKWLTSSEGYAWLDGQGLRFLESESGRWWLASDVGHPWLETEQGIHWLSSTAGKLFLESQQALLWANTSTYKSSTPLGTQVRKAWFDTESGREWKYQFCPDGNPPVPPQSPQRLSHPAPRARIPNCFMNLNFRCWRFVMYPEGAAEESKAQRPQQRRELRYSTRHVQLT